MRCASELCWSVGAITACLAAALAGCTSSGDDDGQGGEAGTLTGGSTARGGSGGSTAGVTSSGGAGSGGVTSSGGTAGSGGTGNNGGMPGKGGGAGAAGAGGGSAGVGGAGGSSGTVGGAGAGAAGSSVGGAGTGGTSNGGDGGSSGAAAGGASAGSAGMGSAGAAGMPSTCPPATPLTGGQRYCSNMKGNASGGYAYELWAEGSGTGCMTVFGRDANFSATWSNVEDFLARVGLDFDRTRTPAEIGTLSADFAHTKTGSEDGLTYVGIYGWTVNPLREYYILDDWGSTKPAGVASDGSPRTSVGTLVADGETYDVWMKTRTNKPAITGDNMTFDQYFSIRRTARQCGHISISQHFSKWIELGLQLGDLVEAKLLAEAQSNSGTIEFTTAKVVVE